VLSRQIKVVVPPVGLRVPVPRSVLSPNALVVCPRADRFPSSGTVHPSVNVSRPPAALRVPLVEQDDTLLKARMEYASVFSMESTDLTVPPHLQDMFDKSVTKVILLRRINAALPHSRAVRATHLNLLAR